MGRVVIAGLVGGIVVFVWGAVFHMVLPFGTVGLQNLPAEEVLLPAMRQAVPKPGMYFFPGMERNVPADRREAVEKAWVERYRRGPAGLLVVQATNRDPLSSMQLAVELLSNIAGALVAAVLLSMAARAGSGYGARVGFVTLLGLFATLAIDVSYWNWYGFPDTYTCMAVLDQVVGWFLGGLAIAAIVRGRPATAVSPAPRT